MQLTLTDKQFETLLKLSHIGNWVVNAGRLHKDRLKEYDDLLELILKHANETGACPEINRKNKNKLTEDDLMDDRSIMGLVDEFNEGEFWEALPGYLGERDFVRKYTKKEREKMDQKERFIKLMECIEVYEIELEKHGLANLEIKGK